MERLNELFVQTVNKYENFENNKCSYPSTFALRKRCI